MRRSSKLGSWGLVLILVAVGAATALAGSDGDGLSDDDEINIYGTDPFNRDTDGDGAEDGIEVDEGHDPLDSSDCPAWICEKASLGQRLAPFLGPFLVSTIEPADGAQFEDLPPAITVTFNRDVGSSTVGNSTVTLTASGGDGTFNDGNEMDVDPTGIAVDANVVTVDLTGVASADDDYQLTLDGTGGSPITDVIGRVLDGDADGSRGGDFVSTFNVTAPAPPPPAAPTLSQVQSAIFTPTCAVSGCHAGNAPQAGMSLVAGNTWSNTVNVPSIQVALDRVEPNDPNNSYLVQKVEGTGLMARMPRLQPPLTQNQIDMIRDWISAGALDD